jgi:hypothetical protein
MDVEPVVIPPLVQALRNAYIPGKGPYFTIGYRGNFWVANEIMSWSYKLSPQQNSKGVSNGRSTSRPVSTIN